jgi:hypothetical protein
MGTLEAMFDDHGNGDHPGPADDPQLGYISENEHCGFATLDALDEWFDGYHEALAELGFVIAKYSVPLNTVRYGRQQLVFNRGDHWPVEHMTLV